MATWVEDSRSLAISEDQLKELGLNDLTGTHIIAVSCCFRAKLDEQTKQSV
jgi:hypothetical protein